MAVNFQLAPGEYFVACPYDVSHRITNLRMTTHLTKCKANYKTEMARRGKKCVIVRCRYHANHQIDKRDLAYHEEHCENRFSIVPHIVYHASEEFQEKLKADKEREAGKSNAWGKVKAEGSSENAVVDSDPNDEDWDRDCREGYEPGYDPKTKLEKGCFLYNPPGLKKAERKKFKAENRLKSLRIAELEEQAQYQLQPNSPPDQKVNGGHDQGQNEAQAWGQSYGHGSQDVKPKVFAAPSVKSESPGSSSASSSAARVDTKSAK